MKTNRLSILGLVVILLICLSMSQLKYREGAENQSIAAVQMLGNAMNPPPKPTLDYNKVAVEAATNVKALLENPNFKNQIIQTADTVIETAKK
jgi:hypothetical protein|uniref:Uncharacterized protein n=1 Tax=viral metagenome TaxID=1070528 RepID=A0A6C0DWA0_9ZZZZ